MFLGFRDREHRASRVPGGSRGPGESAGAAPMTETPGAYPFDTPKRTAFAYGPGVAPVGMADRAAVVIGHRLLSLVRGNGKESVSPRRGHHPGAGGDERSARR